MCESEDGHADCDSLEIESRENIFDVFGRAMPADGSSGQFSGCDYVCGVCEAEEEIATIQLDASRVVLPPADEAGEAETQHSVYIAFTLLLYAVGMYYLLGADSSNRGPGLPTPWSHILLVRIKTETITPHFGMAALTGCSVLTAGFVLAGCFVLIFVWSRRFEERKTEKHVHGTEDDREQCLFCLSTADEQERNRR